QAALFENGAGRTPRKSRVSDRQALSTEQNRRAGLVAVQPRVAAEAHQQAHPQNIRQVSVVLETDAVAAAVGRVDVGGGSQEEVIALRYSVHYGFAMAHRLKQAICNEVYEKRPLREVVKSVRSIGYDGIELAHFTLADKP